MFGWDELATAVVQVINKVIPDPAQQAQAQLAILQLKQAGQFKEIEVQLAEMQAQTDTNKVEAASSSTFVAGARPFLMWVGGFGVAYQWLLLPLFSFAYTCYTGHALPVKPPEMDPDLMVLVGGLNGLHIAARSYEKVQGVS